MKKIKLNPLDLKSSILILLISFHLFFWDIKLFNNFGLREIVAFGLVFVFLDILKKNVVINLDRKKLYKKIFGIILIFTLHLFSNIFLDGVRFDATSIYALTGIIILFLFIENYYNFIRNNLEKFIFFFLVVLIGSIFFSGIQITSEWEKENLGHCKFFFKFTNIIFKENSHLAMMLPAAIGYLFLTSNKIIYKYFYSFVFCIFFLLQNSMTLTVGLFILIFLIFIYEKKQLKYLIPSVVVFLILISTKNLIQTNQVSCLAKLNSTFSGLLNASKEDISSNNKVVNNVSNQDRIFYNIENKEVARNEKNLFLDLIRKDTPYPKLPRKTYEKKFNLSAAVLINSINISFKTLKNRIFGWGVNRYERAFDYFMFNSIILPPFYHEVYTLNYNDGASNLTKSITEFGIISFIFIPLIFFFFFTDKVNRYEKIFFLTIILTQLLRGAGYFNGGFGFSIIFIILTYLKKNENKKKIN